MSLYDRTPYLILDDANNIVGGLIGQPEESPNRPEADTYSAACERVAALLETLRADNEARFSEEQRVHRRGAFAALSQGMSYGGGQKVRFKLTVCLRI
jgi:hypothetical protein